MQAQLGIGGEATQLKAHARVHLQSLSSAAAMHACKSKHAARHWQDSIHERGKRLAIPQEHDACKEEGKQEDTRQHNACNEQLAFCAVNGHTPSPCGICACLVCLHACIKQNQQCKTSESLWLC